MQGFMAQFALAINWATLKKYRKLHDRVSHAKLMKISPPITKGSQHTANTNTIGGFMLTSLFYIFPHLHTALLKEINMADMN